MHNRKRKTIRESAANKHIRAFINNVCEGELAEANHCLDTAVKEKIKLRIRKNLEESK